MVTANAAAVGLAGEWRVTLHRYLSAVGAASLSSAAPFEALRQAAADWSGDS